MKKNIFFVCLLLLILTAYTNSQNAQYGFYDKYYTGILDNGRQHDYDIFSASNLNVWMHYVNWWDNSPNLHGIHNGWTDWTTNDYRDANISQYGSEIRSVLSQNTSHLYRTIGERPKIDWLCYGQRAEYQAEHTALCENYYDFYSYENSIYNTSYASDIHDNTSFGYGQYVKHCWLPEQGFDAGTPVTILSGLKANRQQVNTHAFSHPYMIDGNHNFYIKPRIRIPTGLPDNTDVCRIIVYSWDGVTIIKDVIIKAKYFKDPQTFQYDGSYIENYFDGITPVNMVIDNLTNGTNKFNPNNYEIGSNTPVPCQVDIQVQWLGNCEMWLDYVRVDDDAANDLFKGNLDPWFQQEVQDIAMQTGDNPLKFYIEEFTFENIPCIKYVNEKLMHYSNNKYKVMCTLNGSEYCIIHRKDLWSSNFYLTPEYVKRTLIDSAGLNEIYTFSYPLVGYKQGDPNFGNEVYVPSDIALKQL
jgi:hypothetical protein